MPIDIVKIAIGGRSTMRVKNQQKFSDEVLSDTAVGARVRDALESWDSSYVQKEIAAKLLMDASAFSRSLNGDRGFSSLELANLAEITNSDLHFLVTGKEDPNKFAYAARQTYDFKERKHTRPTSEKDDASIVQGVQKAYVQASLIEDEDKPETIPNPLPRTAIELRHQLGDNFVRNFSDKVEIKLFTDVFRLPELSNPYSFVTPSGRRVILLNAEANWFHLNFSLAHELAHLALNHDPASTDSKVEVEANRFAAELLLPNEEVEKVDWLSLSIDDLERKIWDWGVSTEVVRNRLNVLKVTCSDTIKSALKKTMPEFFAREGQVAQRMSEALIRKVPEELLALHIRGIEAGLLGKNTLAWLLKTNPDNLPVREPIAGEDSSIDQLAEELGMSLLGSYEMAE